jgi:hypothetical protein
MAAYKCFLPVTSLTKMIILGVFVMGKCNTCSDQIDNSARQHSLLEVRHRMETKPLHDLC